MPLLFIPFVIFDLFNFFYLPFILILLTVGALTILLTRDDIQRYYKTGFAITIMGIFMYFLSSQPLILENHNFGYNKDGEIVNATILWDFSDDHPDRLPSHPLIDRNSNNYNLEDFSGKTYFVSFWATWCGPCIEKKPELDRLKATYQNNPNVEFIDISIDEDRTRWRTFLDAEQPAGLQLITPHVNRTRRTLGISAIPLHYVINAKGVYKEFPTFEQASEALKSSE
ncbi:MAG: redoxin family protein [Bacteroidetes bacterium]|nr:redoxin family protein [Bacteroidota bacterium]